VTTRPPTPQGISAPQAELLEAISRGEIADRYHFRCGWAARWYCLHGRDLMSGGRGGGMGRNVTASVAALVMHGLAMRREGPRQYADHPYALTGAGREALAIVTAGKPSDPVPPHPEEVKP
jgi:hypothetical protein